MSFWGARVSQWVIAGLVGFTPWLWAGLVPWAAIGVGVGGLGVGMAWGLQFVRRRRADSVPLRALLTVLLLSVGGWLAVGRTFSLPRDIFAERHLAEIAAQWPASFVAVSPMVAMLGWTGVLGVLMCVMDAEFGWRERQWILRVALGSAALLALAGSVLLLARVPLIFREARSPISGVPFATFFDSGIAVAFLSLTWPPTAAGYLTESDVLWRRAYGGMAVVSWFALGALGSLGGLLIGAMAWMGLGVWVLWRVPRVALGFPGRRMGMLALLCGIAAAGGALVVGRAPAWRSPWVNVQAKLKTEAAEGVKIGTYQLGAAKRPDGLLLSEEDPTDPDFVPKQRAKLRSAGLSMVTSAGLLGFGAGMWRVVFPHFCEDALLRTHYLQVQFAGNDFWQMLLEWGAVGAVGWVLLFHGGFLAASYRMQRYRAKGGTPGAREGMIVGSALGLLALLACSFRSFPLQVPAIQVQVAFLLGLLWAARGRSRSERPGLSQDSISKSEGT